MCYGCNSLLIVFGKSGRICCWYLIHWNDEKTAASLWSKERLPQNLPTQILKDKPENGSNLWRKIHTPSHINLRVFIFALTCRTDFPHYFSFQSLCFIVLFQLDKTGEVPVCYFFYWNFCLIVLLRFLQEGSPPIPFKQRLCNSYIWSHK